MSETPAISPAEQSARRLSYIHPVTSADQRRLERRTAATAAAFFLPHLHPGMRLLDCGCGPGSITIGLAKAVAPGEVVGIDFQPGQIERARELAAERGVDNVQFEVASVYELPFPPASFDAVFAHQLLLHVLDPQRALGEIRRALTPGGVVGIADDDLATLVWEPRTALMTEVLRLLVRGIEHHGGDPNRARFHRRTLLDAGFSRPIAGASLWTSMVWGTPEETRMIAAWLADQLGHSDFVALVTGQRWTDQATLDAMIAEVLEWGGRPDAFCATLGVTAVGWAT
jgi:ubiquinone/menaquinone biosynthesis C-methylase UbiE